MTRVLVVEDELALRSLIADVLVDAGFAVMTASDGIDGMLALETDDPDVVLLDLVMPGMDGWSFLANCRLNPKLRGVPIGIISAATNAQDAAVMNAPVRVVPKPFDIDELLDAVRDLAAAGAGV